MITYIRCWLRKKRLARNELNDWAKRGYRSPSLPHIKRAVLLRTSLPNTTWVETGTFMGDTTKFLSDNGLTVFTIEPDQNLFDKAKLRFDKDERVHVIHGISEDALPPLLPKLSGNINFWLDGHYSGGFTHKGPTNCPVIKELECIEKNLNKFTKVSILIDDVRCFNPQIAEYSDYPSIDYLVDWARKNKMVWSIEHDIFIAGN